MKLECVFVGKTSEKYIGEGVNLYLNRLQHYVPVSVTIVSPALISGTRDQVMKKEAELVLKKIGGNDFVIVLDERGKEFSSVQFADFFNKSMISGTQKIVFVVGGAFGVSDLVIQRSDLILSFSKFTFTHQMIRLFLVEQVYRAMTIIRREPYHHS